ncbi:jg19203 [Pararge aegeria aegeria]|uniref:Jg19203 protein n=1 Tax=Pararge aegeria aegeria TaxID=348720 RepID=A0A8S4SNC6_9NEOP|nr:jg19203 [Pararge aegeria aegeria]
MRWAGDKSPRRKDFGVASGQSGGALTVHFFILHVAPGRRQFFVTQTTGPNSEASEFWAAFFCCVLKGWFLGDPEAYKLALKVVTE